MKILISNDDGYQAEGIRVLRERLLQDRHDVILVAPSEERSANSQAITWKNPLRVEKIDDKAYHVAGSPADCVKFALCEVCPDADMVVSGINSGPNAGMDTLYSGTVGAAMEAVILGKPAVAVSRDVFRPGGRFEASAEYAARLLPILQKNPLPHGTMLNLNVPALPFEEILGLKLCGLSDVSICAGYEKVASGWVGDWYFLKPDLGMNPQPGSDRALLSAGYATATFLSWSYEIKAPFDLPERL